VVLPFTRRPCSRNESTILLQWWWAYHSIAVFITTFFANFALTEFFEVRRIHLPRI
jgi:hypothetical protein